MEHYDPEKAARVWQRVRSAPSPGANLSGAAALAAAELRQEKLYQQLSRNISEAAQLAQDCQRCGAVLLGLCRHMGISRPQPGNLPPSREPPQALLQKSYAQALQALREYENRQSHPVYGPAFQWLCEQKRQQCCRILALLGSLPQQQAAPTGKAPR